VKRLVLTAVVLVGCGRTAVYEQAPEKRHDCRLFPDPASLEFGAVEPGTIATQTLSVLSAGNDPCELTAIMTTADFSVVMTSASIDPGVALYLPVEFSATGTPLERKGLLSFMSNDATRPLVIVPLHARLTHCTLSVSPPALTWPQQQPGAAATLSTTVTNTGDGRCRITAVDLDGDPSFSTPAAAFDLAPGATQSLPVTFTAPSTTPTERKGTLRIHEATALVTVPLDATIELCVLVASPNPFDLGNVLLNATVTHPLTFSNNGTGTCTVANIGLMADPLFSLPSPPGTLTIAPNTSAGVPIRFTASDSAPPHQRTGSLLFTSNDPSQPMGSVPLSAFINTICTEAGQFIYTVDRNGTLSKFDPATLTSTPIGTLDCPEATLPYSMNLDQAAVAWVVYDDGHLWNVDVSNAHCTSTAFAPGQSGFTGFGMGSVFDSATGKDTLFVAGGPTDTDLATIDLSTLTLSVVGTIDASRTEVSGTGDGQLWVFEPSPPFIERLDPATGMTLEHHDLNAITSVGGYAIKFWGGAFYIFIGTDVWKVDRSSLVAGMNDPTKAPTLVLSTPGLDVVGAGVSTCAPVMGN
jgi:hypothetical protein